MIVFFSGTGNTRHCAERLAERLGESLHEFSPEELRHPEACILTCGSDDVRIIWAFPTYSWGVPPVVARLIEKIKLADNIRRLPHYMLTTCGDDMAYTDRQWRHLAEARGLEAHGAYAVIMPNTYVLMKGFNTDPAALAKSKIEASAPTLEGIASAIENGGGDITVPGSFPWIKSAIIYPWFRRFAMSPRPFHAADGCIGCGLCAKSCPMANIAMKNGRPQWGTDCALCLRCYHICPRHAVAYGKATGAKGQYMFKKS